MFLAWRYKRFHISYIVSWLALGLLLGLALGRLVSFSHTTIVQVSIVAVLISIITLRSRRWFACLLICISGLAIGLSRGAWYEQRLERLDTFIGHEIAIEGKISQDPVLQNGSSWKLQLNNIVIENKPYEGEVFATASSVDTPLRRGDTVTLQGKAKQGFGNFRITLYRSDLIGYDAANDPFVYARDKFATGVRNVMPEPEASLGIGFVAGQKSALPSDFEEQLKIVGLTHVVVASGYNLTILVRFSRRLLARHSRYLAIIGSFLLIASFVATSGMSPSMNRAAVVTVLSLLAWYYGRVFHPVQLILYVASISAFIYPVYVWGDLGWLLSFAAFTGILVVAPIASNMIFKSKDSEDNSFGKLIVETASAQLMTLPIVIVAFGYLPTYALLANIIVAPVIPFAMAATAVAGVVGLLASWAWVVALPASVVVAYVVAVVKWMSALEFAQLGVHVGILEGLIWSLIVFVVCFVVWRRRQVDLMQSNITD